MAPALRLRRVLARTGPVPTRVGQGTASGSGGGAGGARPGERSPSPVGSVLDGPLGLRRTGARAARRRRGRARSRSARAGAHARRRARRHGDRPRRSGHRRPPRERHPALPHGSGPLRRRRHRADPPADGPCTPGAEGRRGRGRGPRLLLGTGGRGHLREAVVPDRGGPGTGLDG